MHMLTGNKGCGRLTAKNRLITQLTLGACVLLGGVCLDTVTAQTTGAGFDSFTTTAPMTAEGQTATQLPDGRWLFVGGHHDTTISGLAFTVDFRPAAQQAAIPALSTHLVYARYGHTATVLPDGTVFIWGGMDASGSLVNAAEILNPSTGDITVFNETGLTPRARHTATLMTDGRVLIVGGDSINGAALQQAEIFDPSALSINGQSVRTLARRTGQQAVLLATGDGLIWGGSDASGNSLTSGELYDSAFNRFSYVDPSDATRLPPNHLLTSPPAVEGTLPPDRATSVAVDARIAVRFSKPLAMWSVTSQTLVVVGPAGAISGKAVAAESGLLAFFTPDAELLPNTTYTVFLKGMFDGQGQGLPATTFSFRTKRLSTDTTTGSNGSNSASGSASSAGSSSGSTASASSSSASSQSSPAKKPPAPKKDDPNTEADEYEDWLPREAHRHGQWRVLGGQNEPRANGVVAVPTPLVAATSVTALSGRVARLNGRPIADVTVSVGGVSTKTDARGRFLLSALSEGTQELTVDGSRSASSGRHYTTHYIQVDVAAGKTTTMADTIYLARLNPANEVVISSPAAQEIVVTHPGIPGMELHIPKGAVIRTREGKIVTRLSITPLPVDRTPFAVPDGFPVYFTIQPAGAFVDNAGTGSTEGIRVIYPNYLNAAPGTRVNFWNYDPAGAGWQVYGNGTVTSDGKQVVPDIGVTQQNLMAFGWGLDNMGNAPPEGPPPGGCVTGGDPVDCATGLFLHSATDFYIADTIPITLTRTYRQNDSISRDFGIGTNHPYGIFLSNPTTTTSAPPMIDLILPDGGKVRFNQVSGTTVNDVVYQHSTTPTRFQGAKLKISTITHAWELTLSDKTVLVFQPHAPNALISIRDRYSNTLTITRSGSQITQVLSPHGRYLNFTYDGANRITQVTDNLGRIAGYQYDASGRLWKATDLDGQLEQYVYDTANRLTTVTDKRGNAMVTNVYDANGRVQQQTLADGAIWQFAYTLDGSNRVTQTDVTDPRGYVRRDTFNGSGYLTQEIRALGQPEQQTYVYSREPATNLLLSITDPLGRVTKLAYDYRGQVTGVTRLYGTANAVTDSFAYSTNYAQLTSYTDPLSHQTQLNYDSNGNLVGVSDALGHSLSASYDGEGKLLSVTNALGKTTQVGYDLGDLASITDPLGRTLSMFTDRVGRAVGVTDSAGNNTRYTYDPLDRVTQTTDAQSGITGLTYDANGNLLTVRDPRNLANHTYTYDSRNRLKTYTDPLSNVETYNYDGLGNLTSKVDRKNQTTSYQYDALNRLKTITYADSSSITLTWDAGNRPTQFVDTLNGSITRQYDGLDQLTQEVSPQGQVDYQYDNAGRRTQLTAAGQSAPVTYLYDNANRLTQIAQSTNIVTLGYDNANRRTSTTLPNGVVESYGFSFADELTSINYDKGATHIGDLAYGYDTAGRRTSQSGSLAKLLMPTTVTTTSYDAANHLTNWGGTTLTYDNAGNLTNLGSATYSWNSRNQLTVTSDGSSSFGYDAFGRRKSRTVSGTSTSYLHDGSNPVTVNGSLMLAGGVDEFYARITSGAATSYLTDALGSTLALTDSNGATTANYSYGAYGQVSKTGTDDSSFQYTGRENDGASNLDYYRARYYSTALNRFISEDPTGLAGGINTYAYVDGNPIGFVDPYGLRDVVVAIWPRSIINGSVGHVYVGEMNGATILSQFPSPHGITGVNTTKNWADTVAAEGGRTPSDVYKVHVSDDDAFDSQVERLKKRPDWNWQPLGSLNETNCTTSAYSALKFGGVNVPEPWIKLLTPNDFRSGLEELLSSGIVTKMPSIPWGR